MNYTLEEYARLTIPDSEYSSQLFDLAIESLQTDFEYFSNQNKDLKMKLDDENYYLILKVDIENDLIELEQVEHG